MMDFRVYRIPTDKRDLILSRNYMTQLRCRSRIWSQFRDNISAAVRAHRDLRGFIQEIRDAESGSEADDGELRAEMQKREAAPPFWSISEGTALELINLAGRLLAGVKSFQDHPANKVTVERGSAQSWTMISKGEGVPLNQEIERAVDRVAKKQLHAEYSGVHLES